METEVFFAEIQRIDDSKFEDIWGEIYEQIAFPPSSQHEDDYQRFLFPVIEKMVDRLNFCQLRPQDNKYIARVHKTDRKRRPDISFLHKKESVLNWHSIIIPLEIETLGNAKEGIGQTIDMLIRTIDANMGRRWFGFGIYTDCQTITFLRVEFKDFNPAVPHRYETSVLKTEPFPLFPGLSASSLQPTEGFKLLARLLLAKPISLGFMPFKEEIVWEDGRLALDEALGCSENFEIYKFQYTGGRDAVLKCAVKPGYKLTRSNAAVFIQLETEYKILSELAKFDAKRKLRFPRVLSYVPGIGIITDLPGLPLESFIFTKNGSQTCTDPKKLFAFMKELVATLQFCHDKEICHCDIRPSNIIVVDDKHPALIDWGIAMNKDSGRTQFIGVAKWGATEFLRSTMNEKKAKFFPRYDLESLAYTAMELYYGSLTWHRGARIEMIIEERKKYLEGLYWLLLLLYWGNYLFIYLDR